MTETLKSVGIDIGTSTTQLVVSELTLENRASPFSVPRIAITQKKIIYRSKIHFTPLLSDTLIDAQGVRDIVSVEYDKADLRREVVQTGAVIITGETARKENAREVLAALSGFAGDFVVATAGPDLEAILAARGAGVDDASKGRSILHFDIGGGTANLALYVDGVLAATGCLDMGGRLVKVVDGIISYVSPPLQGRFPGLSVGSRATPSVLGPPAKEMAAALLETTGLRPVSPLLHFYTTAGTKPMQTENASLSFSGGVADCMFSPPDDPFAYGDMGPFLASAIQTALAEKNVIPRRGTETIRATVVGAGAHAVEVSGSTIFYRDVSFPLKNLPVLRLTPTEEAGDTAAIAAAIGAKLRWYTDEGGLTQVALALAGEQSPPYRRVREVAEGVTLGLKPLTDRGLVTVVAVREDMAKALGQAMFQGVPLLCLDGVDVTNGDYIDVGAPVAGGNVVPVVVKTLAFQTRS